MRLSNLLFVLALATGPAFAQTWEVQAPVELETIPAPARARLPLHTMPTGICWLDGGATWGKGVSMTPEVPLDEPSAFVQVAASGKNVAMAYLEMLGRWTKGEARNRLVLSSDGGQSWAESTGAKLDGMSFFSCLEADPAGDRFLFARAAWPGEPDNKANILKVHTIKAPK